MRDVAYVAGVVQAMKGRLKRQGLDCSHVHASCVHIDDEFEVQISGISRESDLSDETIAMCEAVVIGDAFLSLVEPESPEAIALLESFVEKEQILLHGQRAHGARQSHQANNAARAKSRQLAEWHWFRNQNTNLTATARLIEHELRVLGLKSREGNGFQITTVRRWIRPLAPVSQGCAQQTN